MDRRPDLEPGRESWFMMPAVTIGIVGAGAVGRTLYAAFTRAGCEVRLAHARTGGVTDDSARWAPSAQACADASRLIFLTVPDDRIREVCAAIAWPATAAVVHCSGATPLDALAAARRRGAAVGGFHPLQMFANPAVRSRGWRAAPSPSTSARCARTSRRWTRWVRRSPASIGRWR